MSTKAAQSTKCTSQYPPRCLTLPSWYTLQVLRCIARCVTQRKLRHYLRRNAHKEQIVEDFYKSYPSLVTTQTTLIFWLHMVLVGIFNELLIGLRPFLQQKSTLLSVSRLVNYRMRPKAAVRSVTAHASCLSNRQQLTAPFLHQTAGQSASTPVSSTKC